MPIDHFANRFVCDLIAYEPGKPIEETARELGLRAEDIVKVASNENPLGPSPLAKEAMRKALEDSHIYPDGGGWKLRSAIAERFDMELSNVVLGNGSNEIIELLCHSFLNPKAELIAAKHAFVVYKLMATLFGAKYVEVPDPGFVHDLEGMADAITPDTRLLFIANPNNPTGTFIDGERLARFIAAVPPDVLVVLDEAYTDYLPKDLRYDSIAWLSKHPNLMVSRTLAKAYGLAGLRVGFGLASPAVIDLLNRVRQPFNVNSVAQAGAVAVLNDPAFLERSFEVNLAGMKQVTDGLASLGFDYIPSCANFVSFRVGPAAQVFDRLLKQGVIVRPIAGYGMPEYLRVSIGTRTENQRFLDALASVTAGLPGVRDGKSR